MNTRTARRRGRRDGRAERPTSSSSTGAVPFLSEAREYHNGLLVRADANLQQKLSRMLQKALARKAKLRVLTAEVAALVAREEAAEARIEFHKNQIDGYKQEQPIGRFARTRGISNWAYIPILIMLAEGEVLVTAPALLDLFGENRLSSWIVAYAIGLLTITAAHLIGVFLKSRLDRQRPQEEWVKFITLSVAIAAFMSICVLAILRAGLTEKDMSSFNLFGEGDLGKRIFAVVFFFSIQTAFVVIGSALSFLHYSPAQHDLSAAKSDARWIRINLNRRRRAIRKLTAQKGVPVELIQTEMARLELQRAAIMATYTQVCAAYRDANVHARRDALDGAHVSLQEQSLNSRLHDFSEFLRVADEGLVGADAAN